VPAEAPSTNATTNSAPVTSIGRESTDNRRRLWRGPRLSKRTGRDESPEAAGNPDCGVRRFVGLADGDRPP
jgi:hypothetical protein